MPSSETLQKLAKYFGVTADSLLKGEQLKKFSTFAADKLKGKTKVETIGKDNLHDITAEEIAEVMGSQTLEEICIELFDELNSLGKRVAVERIKELTEIPKYTRSKKDKKIDPEPKPEE